MTPNSLRLIHDELWVCYKNAVGVHQTGEMNMLEEKQYLKLQLEDGTALSNFKDVAGLEEDSIAVAPQSGLYIFTENGNSKVMWVLLNCNRVITYISCDFHFRSIST